MGRVGPLVSPPGPSPLSETEDRGPLKESHPPFLPACLSLPSPLSPSSMPRIELTGGFCTRVSVTPSNNPCWGACLPAAGDHPQPRPETTTNPTWGPSSCISRKSRSSRQRHLLGPGAVLLPATGRGGQPTTGPGGRHPLASWTGSLWSDLRSLQLSSHYQLQKHPPAVHVVILVIDVIEKSGHFSYDHVGISYCRGIPVLRVVLANWTAGSFPADRNASTHPPANSRASEGAAFSPGPGNLGGSVFWGAAALPGNLQKVWNLGPRPPESEAVLDTGHHSLCQGHLLGPGSGVLCCRQAMALRWADTNSECQGLMGSQKRAQE
ncbi:uncharacterized protein LOC124086645 [Marmota monax]|uniref:uncharacterized protein LOC124086645 n=1 Tax=Marmota monax TaxID=9995 RepID=UPI001EB004D6|nr:uncharacterized protein LOC124086645 [Marmota monax]